MSRLLVVLLLLSVPVYAADDMTELGASPWIKDGQTFEVESWGGSWNADTVVRSVASHNLSGRIDHCLSMCVTAASKDPARFCLERFADVEVHQSRRYAGTWRKDKDGYMRFYYEEPIRVVESHGQEVAPAIQAYVDSHGGYRPATLDARNEADDFVRVPYDVAVRVWRACR